MKYRIVMLDGAYLDMEPPAEFDLPQFVHGMRSIGFIVSQQLYIRADMIKAILQVEGPQAPVFTTPDPPKGMMN